MKKYKAIISDIDGTLTPVIPNSLPSARVTEVIKKVTEKGFIFSLASGRPYYLVEYLLRHLNLTSPTITDNGAVITDSKNNSILWESLLSHEEAFAIIKMVKGSNLVRLSSDIINIENPTKIPPGAKVRKISAHGLTSERAEILIKKVEMKFKDLAIVKASAYEGKELIDIYFSNTEATKLHAVIKYAHLLNIDMSEIIGIGDGYNDFPLLMACGFKVAMGNAVPDLKEIADYVAPSVEKDGVAHVLEKFTLS